jgi:zinc and cadmium transporter
MLILWVVLMSLLGSIGSIVMAATFLLFQEKRQKALIPCLISYASGTLLTAALLGLIPHALKHATTFPVLSTVLIGIILFFLLEKLLIWRHCHDAECEMHGTAGPMLLVGDAFHNLTDGVVIAASFLSSIPIGIAASLSVIAHEIPQEVSDFAILIHNGYSMKKALSLNIVSSLSTIPGAILGYYALGVVHSAIPYAMAISASSFLYIALADLTPELHLRVGFLQAIRQFLLILAGAGTIILFLQFHP